MGVYAEAYKSCPDCGSVCVIQLSGVKTDVDQFNLDKPEELAAEYTLSELKRLQDQLLEERFYCEDCEKPFFANGQPQSDRLKLARKICGHTDD